MKYFFEDSIRGFECDPSVYFLPKRGSSDPRLSIIKTAVYMSCNINHGCYVNCRVSLTMCWPWGFLHQLES